MRPRFFAVPFVCLLFVSGGMARSEVTIDALMPALAQLQAADVTVDKCDREVARASEGNSPNLFLGSGVCFGAHDEQRGTFLLLAGQIRSTTDFSLFEPNSESDKMAMGNLWGILFYRLGGAGSYEIYRDPELREKLFTNLRNWDPQVPDGYSPGWEFRSSPTQSAYRNAIEQAREHRIAQLQEFAKLISDSEYFAARSELDTIQRRNPRGIEVRSPDGKRAAELSELMRAAQTRLKQGESK